MLERMYEFFDRLVKKKNRGARALERLPRRSYKAFAGAALTRLGLREHTISPSDQPGQFRSLEMGYSDDAHDPRSDFEGYNPAALALESVSRALEARWPRLWRRSLTKMVERPVFG